MAMAHRIFLPIDSHTDKSWALALACAEQINKASSPHVSDVILLLHQKSLLSHTTLAAFLGKAHAKMLRDGKQLRLPSGATLRVETKRT
jgi:hypothetical protein